MHQFVKKMISIHFMAIPLMGDKFEFTNVTYLLNQQKCTNSGIYSIYSAAHFSVVW